MSKMTYQSEAFRLYELAEQEELLAGDVSDDLKDQAASDIDHDIERGRISAKYRNFYIERRLAALKEASSEYQNHIGMNQFYHRKGTYAALLALLEKQQ